MAFLLDCIDELQAYLIIEIELYYLKLLSAGLLDNEGYFRPRKK